MKVEENAKKYRFAREVKPKMPEDPLAMDVLRAELLGYGCHYGQYKADHPHTRAENEARLEEMKKKKPRARRYIFTTYEVYCAACGAKFYTTNRKKRYCSDTCGKKKRNADFRAKKKQEAQNENDNQESQ